MNNIIINTFAAFKIANSKKDFLLYDIDQNNNIVSYKLSNELTSYYDNSYKHFILVDLVKCNISLKTIIKL